MPRLVQALLVGLVVLACLPLIAWWAIPGTTLESALERRLSRETGLPVGIHRLTKRIVPGFAVESIFVSTGGAEIEAAGPLRVRLRWRDLLRAQVVVLVDGESFGGRLDSRTERSSESLRVTAKVLGGQLDRIASIAGMDADGLVDATATMQDNGTWRLRFGLYDVRVGPTLQARLPIPVEKVSAIEGEAAVSPDGQIRISSASMVGDGVSATVSGTVTGSALALIVVITPSAEWLDRRALLVPMLEPYRKGPGVFSIPIRGTLRSPRMG